MRRYLTIALLCSALLPLSACKGGGEESDGPSVIGDGIRPVVLSAEYTCFTDANGGNFFYFRIEGDDEQGASTITINGANVLFKDSSGEALDWDGDGSADPDVFLDLNCAADTDPRRCEGSLLEGDVSGACSETTLQFEGWMVDEDGNESDRVNGFEQNGGIAPAG